MCQTVQPEFIDEIRLHPAALRDFVRGSKGETQLEEKISAMMAGISSPRFVFTGMGSSLFASELAATYLRHRGCEVAAVDSYELMRYDARFFTENTVVIAISQSGGSPEVLDLLAQLPETVKVIGVTNYPASALYRATEMTALIYAGPEYRTATKTYTNTLAAVMILANRLVGDRAEVERLWDEMLRCADTMDALLAREGLGAQVADFFEGATFVPFVGSGFSYTSACQSEIVTEEAAKLSCSRFSSAEFIHGPIELINEGMHVMIYDFDPLSRPKCDDVRGSVLAYGGKVFLVTNRTDVQPQPNQTVCVIPHDDPLTSILVDILPMELGVDEYNRRRGILAGHLHRVVKRIAL